MSNTRSLRNRSSRYSSPATFADSQDSASQPAQQQSIETGLSSENGTPSQSLKVQASWVEPAVRNAVPSFEDTRGLERMGVLEHMQPLGTPPTTKALARLKLNMPRVSPSSRATPMQSEEVASPVTETARTEIVTPIDPELLSEPVRSEEPVISSPPRGRPAKREVEEMRHVATEERMLTSPMKTHSYGSQTSPKPASIQEHIREERMRGYINQAVSKAGSDGRHELIPGLTRVFEEAKQEPQVFSALEAILQNRTNVSLDQFKIFKHFIKKGIKRHRRSSTNNADLAHFQSHQPFVSRPQPVAYVSTFPSRTLSSVPPPPPPTTTDQQPTIRTPLRIRTNNTAFQNSVSPSMSTSMSPGIMSATDQADDDIVVVDDSQHNRKRAAKRAGSESTTSSLSSAKSVSNEFPPVEADADSDPATEGRSSRSAGLRQAHSRGATGSRTRSSGIDQTSYKHPYDGFKTTNQLVSKKIKLKPPTEAELELDREVEKERQNFEDNSFYDYNYQPKRDSSIRTVVHGQPKSPQDISVTTGPPPPVIHASSLNPMSATLSSPASHIGPEFPLPNGTGRKRTHDEIEPNVQDLSGSTPSPEPSTRLASRAANNLRSSTPRAAKALPPGKYRKSARVMISPNKPKNGGVTAGRPGLSRAGTGRESTIGNGADTQAEDNEEVCRSCGGEGTLLCCDGCPNSFHHECLEPPLDPEDEIEGSWYCPECVARQNKEPFQDTGLLSLLVHRVEDTIPKAYALPYEIRDYFEGVKTGDEGEYEDVGIARTQKNQPRMNRQGLFEQQNYKDLRDSKGNFRHCYKCGLTADGRDIIPCDFCPNEWHLDCVDPPLAIPPRRIIDGKQTGSWRCPLHIEDDLKNLSRQVEAAPGDLGRVPRLRRPRDAKPKDIGFPRGYRNNGIIEIQLEKDEMPDIKEVEMDRGVYRLPEKGIKLDFIDRAKQKWYEDHAIPARLGLPKKFHKKTYRPDGSIVYYPATLTVVNSKEPTFLTSVTAVNVAESAKANAKLRQKSFLEQRVALGLVEMSGQNGLPQEGLSIDPMSDLINQLVADAPQEVEQMTNRSEREQLLLLQEQIKRRLSVLDRDGEDAPIPEAPKSTLPPNTMGQKNIKSENNKTARQELDEVPLDTRVMSRHEHWLNGDIATAKAIHSQVNGGEDEEGNGRLGTDVEMLVD